MNVNWKKNSAGKVGTFGDIDVNECFVLDTAKSKGAVYLKVKDVHGEYFKVEIETGKLFECSDSIAVKIVDMDVIIRDDKPALYR